MRISGIWIGTIVYGNIYRSSSGKDLTFEMTIEQVSDLLTGIYIDISGMGVNKDSATIEGNTSLYFSVRNTDRSIVGQ